MLIRRSVDSVRFRMPANHRSLALETWCIVSCDSRAFDVVRHIARNYYFLSSITISRLIEKDPFKLDLLQTGIKKSHNLFP